MLFSPSAIMFLISHLLRFQMILSNRQHPLLQHLIPSFHSLFHQSSIFKDETTGLSFKISIRISVKLNFMSGTFPLCINDLFVF
ncbi:hypothetical protein B9Z55_011929 [Caenorhabditis nigoni]|uniref:Uncharacterized protein n=1 Tax=Caenorhabditis nigoni TaxID=1611254 RepID=A0A2G5UN27_9PELO|nr:hypothetical protein B9Z55_011929 [Caenorhabditis nigoni]